LSASPIKLLKSGVDVGDLQKQLADNEQLWDAIPLRTKNRYVNTFEGTSDIWVRCNDLKNYNPEDPTHFVDEHRPVWYPAFYQLPALTDLIFDLMAFVKGEELGGVLITRVRPGCKIKPHIDYGWHQAYYDKYAIQIKGNEKQSFNFEAGSLSPKDGDVFWFDNSFLHWINNDSDEDRITLIVAIKSHGGK